MVLWILLAGWLAGLACIPHLLLLNKRPTATLAWLWALLLFPYFGAALYLMIGSEKVKQRRRHRRRRFRDRDRWSDARSHAQKRWKSLVREKDLDASDQALLESLSAITQLPVATSTSQRILHKANAYYPALKDDIVRAQHTIDIQSYIWHEDEVGAEFLGLLIAAVKRGVVVRVLIDELGSFWTRESYFRPLVEAGGHFSWCHTLSPLRNRYSFNLRNHRKLQVIDGRTAYVGGMNFGREYLGREAACGDWSDTQIRLEGTVVELLHQMFAEDWYFATDEVEAPHPVRAESSGDASFVQVLRGGPDEDDQPMQRTNLALFTAAKKRLWIASGYFVPGETMQTALQVAVARGVDVRILVSLRSQHPLLVKAGRSYYDALLRQGIRIYEYSCGIEHSKYIIIDDEWTSIGSSNLDERSMRLNFELSVLTLNRAMNRELAAIFEQTLAEAKEINRKAFARRPLSEKLIESAMRPFSPVL
jgi:cardiolipin synthase